MKEQLIKMPNAHGSGEILERPFLRVVFQSGLPREVGINGCRVEDVIDVAMERLRDFQKGPLACQENEDALRNLELAKHALHLRIQRRQEQGVYNTLQRHEVVRTEDEEQDFSATGA